MDEDFWFSSTDPLALLEALHPQRTLGSDQPQTRVSRMYLLACARRQWEQLPRVCRVLVALAEMVAEAPRAREPLRAVSAAIAAELMHSDGDDGDFKAADDALEEANIADELELARREAGTDAPPNYPLPALWWPLVRLVYLPFELNTPSYHWVNPELHSVDLLREVYGNPCRRIPFEREWRTDTAVSLARQMYETRDFSAMPILADALQDAGCDSEEILSHCRTPGEHVRGCWVLDLVLKLR